MANESASTLITGCSSPSVHRIRHPPCHVRCRRASHSETKSRTGTISRLLLGDALRPIGNAFPYRAYPTYPFRSHSNTLARRIASSFGAGTLIRRTSSTAVYITLPLQDDGDYFGPVQSKIVVSGSGSCSLDSQAVERETSRAFLAVPKAFDVNLFLCNNTHNNTYLITSFMGW